jgi:uncharacterized protein
VTQAAIATINKPAWVDLATKDAAGARDFYGKLFGWQVEVNPDPQYGEYGRARFEGKDVAGIGPTQAPDQPTAWALYIGTEDADELARRVDAAGGTLAGSPFDVGDQGRMAVFRDPSGAFISTWQAARMGGFQSQGKHAYAWTELNARNVEQAIPFYEKVFGWATRRSEMPDAPDYTEFLVDGESIAGAWEMNPNVPAGAPNSGWSTSASMTSTRPRGRRSISAGAR